MGDLVRCEIANDTTNYCYKTGPYSRGQGNSLYNWSWGKYYNWDIKSAELVSLDIEYMDGSTYYFDSDQIKAVQY